MHDIDINSPTTSKIVLKLRGQDKYIIVYRNSDVDIIKSTNCQYAARVVDGEGKHVEMSPEQIHFQIFNALWFFATESMKSE